jgi:hypothetical protein
MRRIRRFLFGLMSTVTLCPCRALLLQAEKFPRVYKFTLGDRIINRILLIT